YRIAGAQPLRRQDVGKFAIVIANEGDKGRAVRIVFEPFDDGRDAELIALEIDDPVAPLMAAATPAQGRAPGVVAATGAAQALGQRLLRLSLPQLAPIYAHPLPLRWRRRIEGLQSHGADLLVSNSGRHVDPLARAKGDDRLLIIRATTEPAA